MKFGFLLILIVLVCSCNDDDRVMIESGRCANYLSTGEIADRHREVLAYAYDYSFTNPDDWGIYRMDYDCNEWIPYYKPEVDTDSLDLLFAELNQFWRDLSYCEDRAIGSACVGLEIPTGVECVDGEVKLIGSGVFE